MRLVGDFLSRFQNLTPPNDSLKKAVAESIREAVGVKLSKNAVRIDQRVAFISASSVLKNTMRINRGKILELLYEKAPKARDTVRDIR